MSTEHPSIHPDWLEAPPRPGMSTAAKVFVGLGIAGGLVSAVACAAVVMGLMERGQMAAAPSDADLPRRGSAFPQPSRVDPLEMPVVLTASEDRTARAPEEFAVRTPGTQDVARERTKVTVQVRFLELDAAALGKRTAQEALKSGMAGRRALLEGLTGALSGQSTSIGNQPDSAALTAALDELAREGVVRVLGGAQTTTFDRLPVKVVEETGDGQDRSRPSTVTIECIPTVLDRGHVRLHLAAELSTPSPGVQDPPRTRGVTTEVEIRDGQTLALGGAATQSGGGAHSRSVILLTANVQPPAGLEALAPLTDAERRQRSAKRCRFVEEEVARRFPESEVHLDVAAGKLFVRGTSRDHEQVEQIMKAIGRRADQLRIVAGADAAADSYLVNMLRTTPVSQVVIRMKLFEMDRRAAAEAAGHSATVPADQRQLLDALLGIADSRRSAVLEGLDADRLESAVEALKDRGLVRITSAPTLATTSRRKATVAIGREVALPDDAAENENLDSKPVQYTCGTIIDALPVVLKDGRIRVEVTPYFRELVEDGRGSNPPRLVLASQSVTAVAVIRSGQTLAVAGLPAATTAASGNPMRNERAPGQPGQFLLVTAEVVRPGVSVAAKQPTASRSAIPRESPARPKASPRPTTPQADSGRGDSDLLGEFFRKTRPIGYPRTSGTKDDTPAVVDLPSEARIPELPVIGQETAQLAKSQAEQQRQRKVRVLGGVLAELFPHGNVQLRLVGDDLTVDGRAEDARQAAQIVEVVRAEAAKLSLSVEPVKVIDRLRMPAAEPVTLRVTILELNSDQIRNSPEFLRPRTPQAAKFVRSLIAVAEKDGHTVLVPAEHGKVDDEIRVLSMRRLLRVLDKPVISTSSGRAADHMLLHKVSPTTFLPVVLQDGAIRLEISETSRSTAEGARRAVTVQLQPGAVLAMRGSQPRQTGPGGGRASVIVLVEPELPGKVDRRARTARLPRASRIPMGPRDGPTRSGPARSGPPLGVPISDIPKRPLSRARIPADARLPNVARPAAAGNPARPPSAPGFDVAESAGPPPAARAEPPATEPEPKRRGILGLPHLLDRFKPAQPPRETQPSGAAESAPPSR